MALKAGDLLNDRYSIEGELGRGAMGAVYRAQDNLRDQPCAIKELILEGQIEGEQETGGERRPQPDSTVYHRGAAPGPTQEVRTLPEGTLPRAASGAVTRGDVTAQFRDAAKLLARLSHEGLTQVMDYFASGSAYYLVTALVEGEDLATRLEREVNNRCPVDQVLEWMDQVLKILAYCHGQRVVHRDIKPENIIVEQGRRLFLVDFGIAQPLGRDGKVVRGLNAVSHGYSPPEQYEGRTDQRSDLYAVGATMYTLLTGQPPPKAQERQAGAAIEPPSSLVRGIPPRVDAAILKALELEPSARWESAEALRAVLPSSGRLSRDDVFVLGARVGAVAWCGARSGGSVRLAAGCSDRTVKIWDVDQGQLLHNLAGHSGYVYSVGVSRDGDLLASASSDGTVKVWRLDNGKLLRTLPAGSGAALCVAFSPNSDVLAAGYDDSVVHLWDYRKGERIRQSLACGGHVFAVAYAPDQAGLMYGTAGGQVGWYDLAAGETQILRRPSQAAVRAVAVSPDGRWAAAADLDGCVTTWNLPALEIRHSFRSENPPVWSLACSPDTRWLAAALGDGTLMLRDAESGRPVSGPLIGHRQAVRSIAFAPAVPLKGGSRMLLGSGSDDGTLRLWWLE